jgi:hypothetical protein
VREDKLWGLTERGNRGEGSREEVQSERERGMRGESESEERKKKEDTHPDETPIPMPKVHHHRPVIRVIFFEAARRAGGDGGNFVRGVHRNVEALEGGRIGSKMGLVQGKRNRGHVRILGARAKEERRLGRMSRVRFEKESGNLLHRRSDEDEERLVLELRA